MIAVTGGHGFIGSRVIKELESRGVEAVSLDRQAGLNLFENEAQRFIHRAEGVIHLAGVLGTGELFEHPHDAVRVNVDGALTVLRACSIGGARYVGITMPSVWANIYQATKRCAYDLAEAYRQHRGVPVSHVRAYNVFGPGQKVGPPQKIVPTFADHAWRGLPIPIWGDGQQTVDLVHVDDVARMLVDALEYGDGEVFDAGTGIEQTVNFVAGRVAGIVEGLGGPRADILNLDMRVGETPGTHLAAAGEGWDLLGWWPTWSSGRLVDVVESYRSVDR